MEEEEGGILSSILPCYHSTKTNKQQFVAMPSLVSVNSSLALTTIQHASPIARALPCDHLDNPPEAQPSSSGKSTKTLYFGWVHVARCSLSHHVLTPTRSLQLALDFPGRWEFRNKFIPCLLFEEKNVDGTSMHE